MKPRSVDPQKLETEIEKLRHRLAAAEAESKRIAAKRITTERKLEDLGKQLADLKRDLAEVTGENTRRNESAHSASAGRRLPEDPGISSFRQR
jgi:septal ring factor EnvC (AmiA/AmiB activator)